MSRKFAAAVLFTFSLTALAAPPPALKLPDGTTFLVVLKDKVQAQRAHPDDPIRARVQSPVLVQGRVLIPAGATLLGRVTSAVSHRARGAASRLGIRFERAEWKGGSAALNAYIVGQMKRTVRADEADPNLAQRCRWQSGNGVFPPGQPGDPFSPAQNPFPPVDDPPGPWMMPSAGNRTTTADPACLQLRDRDPVVHDTPVTKGTDLHRLANPPGATELVSQSKNVELQKGTWLELRHSAM